MLTNAVERVSVLDLESSINPQENGTTAQVNFALVTFLNIIQI